MSGGGLGLEGWRRLAIVALLLSATLLGILLWRDRDALFAPEGPEPEPVEPTLRLVAASWTDLPGWSEDGLDGFAAALARSCGVFARRDPAAPLHASGVGGVVGDWLPLCRELDPDAPAGELRALLETLLRPWSMRADAADTGLLTGYYEASLHGSRRRTEEFSTPLYRRPADLVSVELGEFREDLAGRRLAGRVRGNRLEPYADRSELERGALAGEALELVWVNDPVDAFFLHIQGSGRVELDDGSEMRVGYDGQNGHPYVAIGRELVARGAMPLEEVSMQSIRAWLAAHPEARDEVMRANPSYVFFRELQGEGPVGSLGVALEPRRSLAVDRAFLPLGVPLWVDGMAPRPAPSTDEEPLRRLLVAQDTGGAIRGPLRGDVFWGHGDDAADVAGRMRHEARLWLLLPAAAAPPARLADTG